nr:hypothetical protein [uncultured Holophaga sp.]
MGELLKWLSGLLTGGVLLWIVQQGWGRHLKRVERKQKKVNLITYLCGLPDEMKAVLLQHHIKGAHTLKGNPGDLATAELIRQGILRLGGAGGEFASVNSYLSVRPDIWEVMRNDWERSDAAFFLRVFGTEDLASEHNQGPYDPA